MSSILEAEQRRARWRRHLAVEGVDDIRCQDFARGGLASRLDSMLARMFLLPEDPDTECWDFDSAFWVELEKHKIVDLDNGMIHLGDELIPTAHAAAIVYRYGKNAAMDCDTRRFIAMAWSSLVSGNDAINRPMAVIQKGPPTWTS